MVGMGVRSLIPGVVGELVTLQTLRADYVRFEDRAVAERARLLVDALLHQLVRRRHLVQARVELLAHIGVQCRAEFMLHS